MNFLRKYFEGKDKETLGKLAVIFAIGLLLLTMGGSLFPKNKTETVKPTANNMQQNSSTDNLSYEKSLEDRLSTILSKVDGAGAVSVMVTLSQDKEVVFKDSTDESFNQTRETAVDGSEKDSLVTSKKQDPVIIKGSTGADQPMIVTEKVPKVEGVIIVAEGGGNVYVKDAMIRSVIAILNVPSYKVEVLKGTSKLNYIK